MASLPSDSDSGPLQVGDRVRILRDEIDLLVGLEGKVTRLGPPLHVDVDASSILFSIIPRKYARADLRRLA